MDRRGLADGVAEVPGGAGDMPYLADAREEAVESTYRDVGAVVGPGLGEAEDMEGEQDMPAAGGVEEGSWRIVAGDVAGLGEEGRLGCGSRASLYHAEDRLLEHDQLGSNAGESF